MKFNLTIEELYHVKIVCSNCRKGDANDVSPEENNEYYAVLHNGDGQAIDRNLVSGTPCEHCGCNLFAVTAKLKLKIDKK